MELLGQILGFLWTVAAIFFLISVFALPICLAYWRKREREDAAKTEATLRRLGFDHSHRFEQDAL